MVKKQDDKKNKEIKKISSHSNVCRCSICAKSYIKRKKQRGESNEDEKKYICKECEDTVHGLV